MSDVAIALGRALRSLRMPGIVWHMIWPALVAIVLWSVAAIVSWSVLIAVTVEAIANWPLVGPWMSGSEVATATIVILVKIGFILALVPLTYLTAAILVSIFAIPMMLEHVALRDYADLEQRRGGTNLGSLWTTVSAGGIFLLLLVVSLPFWLIPGVALVVPLVLTAWLNKRAFSYDALMLHADRDELIKLPRVRREALFLLGGGCALLAYVPFVNLLAPAFSGLAFVHFMLQALRHEREVCGATIVDPASALE